MTALFIASDGHELCLWEGDPTDSSPRCVERESDVDPIVWALIVRSVSAHREILPGPTLAEGLPHLFAADRGCADPTCRGKRCGFAPAAAESARALHECEVAS